jgi:heme oxygenase
MSLAARLQERTAALHLAAERAGYVREILQRRASEAGYALYLRNLLPAYEAIEHGLRRHAAAAALAGVDWPALARSRRIDQDLRVLDGPDWAAALPLLPAATAYGDAVHEASDSGPLGLIGHAYVRYLGDLSGGQIVKTLLSRAPGIAPDALTFYDFPAIPDARAFKEAFRRALDRMASTEAWLEPVLDAAARGFEHNIAISLAVQDALDEAGDALTA